MAEGSGYKEYVAGLLAGLSMVIVGHPFDTVKVKLQKHNTEGNGMKYKSSLHCTTRILQTEGVKGLYRSATSSFLGMAFESSLAFGIYSQMKQFLQLTGMFRGGGTTLLRESIGNAVFFSTYEYVRYHMHQPMRHTSSDLSNFIDVGVGIVSGGLGGIACWCAVLPLDVAKTIIQTSTDRNHTRNPFQILELIYKRSGFKGCYTGLGPTIVRAFPANAAAIVTWEMAVKLLGIKRE